ncbi:MAG: hypothetical protein C0605_02120 [Hyphomicrobiales bacterium]|nr:MAG: hypothetical protein C0605_02120 [Hyphomicrobiales bacterium]
MQSAEESDEDLMRLVSARDAAAFARLVDRHLARVHGLARRLLGRPADAEDVVQDVMAKLWTAPEAWSASKGNFPNWLSRVTSNACIDRLRRRRPDTGLDEVMTMTADEAAPDPFDKAFDTQRANRIEQALERLPERQKLAIVLFHFQGHSGAEVARIMDIKLAAMESLLARARRKLKADLADDLQALLTDN